MTNLEKLKLFTKHIQFMLDEDIVTEENCCTLLEEVFSAMEVLVDCNEEFEKAFIDELELLRKVL